MTTDETVTFTVIFNYAKTQIPIAKKNLAETDIPYEITEQRWLDSTSKTRAQVTFRTDTKAHAKRLRETIPVQRGMLFGCFLAAECSKEAQAVIREFRKKALELGYSKYSVDRTCWKMKFWDDPAKWKTATRKELEAYFADYKSAVDLIVSVQEGKRRDKDAEYSKKVVKDKLYRLSEASGIPKGYLHLVLDVSETSLRKWSYNPANVTEELSDRIFRRIACMDADRMRMSPVDGERLPSRYFEGFSSPTPAATDYLYEVHIGGSKILTRDFYPVLRNAVHWAEERGCHAGERKRSRTGQYSRIAKDKSLEMPVGVTKWDEELLGKEHA